MKRSNGTLFMAERTSASRITSLAGQHLHVKMVMKTLFDNISKK